MSTQLIDIQSDSNQTRWENVGNQPFPKKYNRLANRIIVLGSYVPAFITSLILENNTSPWSEFENFPYQPHNREIFESLTTEKSSRIPKLLPTEPKGNKLVETLHNADFPIKCVFYSTGFELNPIGFSKNNTTLMPDINEMEFDMMVNSLKRIFANSREEIFEDGMNSEFSTNLVRYIKDHGIVAINALIYLIPTGKVNVEVGSEALRWVGRMQDDLTYEIRRWLLEHSLFSKFPSIRDGAALGLASMDDPHAIYYLRSAIEKEPIDELKIDLEQVLNDIVRR